MEPITDAAMLRVLVLMAEADGNIASKELEAADHLQLDVLCLAQRPQRCGPQERCNLHSREQTPLTLKRPIR